MSIVRTYSVFCDGPGEHPFKTCLEWVAETVDGIAAARQMARGAGWKRVGGKDLCPACQQKAKA